jgi:hypothetical protein
MSSALAAGVRCSCREFFPLRLKALVIVAAITGIAESDAPIRIVYFSADG